MGRKSSSGSKLLGQFLRQLRGSRSLQAIEDLSKAPPLAGRIRPVDVSTLSKIETGKQYPSLTTLLSLEQIYEVPIQRFLDHVKLEKHWELRPPTGDHDEAMKEAYDAVGRGDFQAAYAAFLLAESLAPDRVRRDVATHNKAGTLWNMGMLQEAINEYCDLLADLSLGVELQAKALTNLAAVHRAKGNLLEARLHAQEGLRIADGLDLRRSQAFLHRILGNLLDDLHEYSQEPDDRTLREALRHHEKSTSVFLELGLDGEAAVNRVNMGSIYCRLGNFIVGFKSLREGLEVCESHGNKRNIAFALKELGRGYYLSGNHVKARDYFFECERISDRHGYVDFLFMCYFYLREIDVAAGGRGAYEQKRLLRLYPMQEGSFFELNAFKRTLDEPKEQVG